MPRKSKNKGARSHDDTNNGTTNGDGVGAAQTARGVPETDTSSVTSHGSLLSGAGAIDEHSTGADSEEVDEQSADVLFEDKLVEYIDKITEKSLQERLTGLKGVCSALAKKYIPDFLSDRKLTIADCLERILKRGKSEERVLAARGAALLCAQLGADSADCEDVYGQLLRPTLLYAIEDETATAAARTACAEALGVCGFITSEDAELVSEVMEKFEALFSKSYLARDGSVPLHVPDVCLLHSVAVQAWCLLLTVSPASAVRTCIDRHHHRLAGLLQSPSVELRIAAGEALALIHELGCDLDEEFSDREGPSLCDTLRGLATDSSKFRAKKDRRQQRSSFRDILRAIEEGEAPDLNYKFGAEVLYIDSWVRKRQYDAFCNVFASGMNTQLQDNLLMRDIFGLGSPLVVGPSTKMSKNDKRLYNAAQFKARTKARQKFRDKRVANISG